METRRWTKEAIGCYMRGCNCKVCPNFRLYFNYKHRCRIKYAVLELVRKHGILENMKRNMIIEDKENG